MFYFVYIPEKESKCIDLTQYGWETGDMTKLFPDFFRYDDSKSMLIFFKKIEYDTSKVWWMSLANQALAELSNVLENNNIFVDSFKKYDLYGHIFSGDKKEWLGIFSEFGTFHHFDDYIETKNEYIEGEKNEI